MTLNVIHIKPKQIKKNGIIAANNVSMLSAIIFLY